MAIRSLCGTKRKALRISGFLTRMKSVKGKKTIKLRRNKGRKKL